MKLASLLSLATLVAFQGCSTKSTFQQRVNSRHTAAGLGSITIDELRGITAGKPIRASKVRVTFSGLEAHGTKSAPAVETKIGNMATVELIREFRYPTAFDFPQPSQSSGGPIALTPTTPTEFETQNTGLMIEFTPELRGPVVVLKGVVRERIFEGFTQSAGEVFRPIVTKDGAVITPNRVHAPMFTTRETPIYAALRPGKPDAFMVNTERGIRRLNVLCEVVP